MFWGWCKRFLEYWQMLTLASHVVRQLMATISRWVTDWSSLSLSYTISITATLCTLPMLFSRLATLNSLLSVCSYHPIDTQPQTCSDYYWKLALYKSFTYLLIVLAKLLEISCMILFKRFPIGIKSVFLYVKWIYDENSTTAYQNEGQYAISIW